MRLMKSDDGLIDLNCRSGMRTLIISELEYVIVQSLFL